MKTSLITTLMENHSPLLVFLTIGPVALFFLLSVFMWLRMRNSSTYWFISSIFSFFMFLGSYTILYTFYHVDTSQSQINNTPIYTITEQNSFLDKNTKQREMDPSLQYLIPTGVIIKSINIQNENTVSLSGSIWQTYTQKDKDLAKEVVILNARSSQITPTYQLKTENGIVYGFDFKVELIKQLDYTQFPLDKQKINVELAHSSLTKPVILTPDFSSWKTDENQQIGIDENLNPTKLAIEKTYYSYTTKKSSANHGVKDYIFANNFPVLNFNINIKREVINLLILVFLPVITILVLSFAFLLMFRRLFSRPHSYLSINAAILFALIVSHQRLRDLIPSNVPSYPEYAYFLSYIIILFNIMLAVRYVKTLGSTETIKSMPKETLFFRLMYWPFVFTNFLIITVMFFT
ncbi:MAG: hypothetical protein WD055_05310 [Candidatus Dependentiae bacterium]